MPYFVHRLRRQEHHSCVTIWRRSRMELALCSLKEVFWMTGFLDQESEICYTVFCFCPCTWAKGIYMTRLIVFKNCSLSAWREVQGRSTEQPPQTVGAPLPVSWIWAITCSAFSNGPLERVRIPFGQSTAIMGVLADDVQFFISRGWLSLVVRFLVEKNSSSSPQGYWKKRLAPKPSMGYV